ERLSPGPACMQHLVIEGFYEPRIDHPCINPCFLECCGCIDCEVQGRPEGNDCHILTGDDLLPFSKPERLPLFTHIQTFYVSSRITYGSRTFMPERQIDHLGRFNFIFRHHEYRIRKR